MRARPLTVPTTRQIAQQGGLCNVRCSASGPNAMTVLRSMAMSWRSGGLGDPTGAVTGSRAAITWLRKHRKPSLKLWCSSSRNDVLGRPHALPKARLPGTPPCHALFVRRQGPNNSARASQ